MCCVYDSKKIENNPRKGIMLYNCINTYSNILHLASKRILYLTRLRFLAIEIFKTLNDMSPLYMKDVFSKGGYLWT